MATTRFDDLSELLDPNLYLKADGIIYPVAAIDINEAERIHPLIWGPEARNFGPEDEWRECLKILGRAPADAPESPLDLMRRRAVPAPYFGHMGRTALIHFCSGPQGPELGRAWWRWADLTERIDAAKLMEYLVQQEEYLANEQAARDAMAADG